MMKLRPTLLALLALFSLGSLTRAASPPDVPPIADADRYQSFTLNASTSSIDLTFPVFGDGTDLRVLTNGAPLTSGWTFVSKSGVALTNLALPITDGQIVFSPALASGIYLEISGAWHPRRTVQPTAPGITRREFNLSSSTLIASQRELWRIVSRLGHSLSSGVGAPSSATGLDGDYYIDSSAARLYGPKLNGQWPFSFTAMAGTTGAAGATGPQGPAWNAWKGAWSSGTAYVINDVVSSAGSSYIAIAPSTAAPPPGATWNVIASAGSNGAGSGTVTQVNTSAPLSGGPITTTGTLSISTNGITNSLLAQMAANTLKCNGTGSTANAAECTLGATLSFSSGALQTGAGTGDVSWSANGFSTTIGAGAVSFSKIASGAVASAANYQANASSVLLGPNAVWSAAAPVALTDGATITPDFSAGLNFSVTLGGSRALANPSNAKAGQSGVLRVTQDGTGSRTLTYGTSYKWAGGTACTLSTAASKVDYVFFFAFSSTEVLLNCALDVR